MLRGVNRHRIFNLNTNMSSRIVEMLANLRWMFPLLRWSKCLLAYCYCSGIGPNTPGPRDVETVKRLNASWGRTASLWHTQAQPSGSNEEELQDVHQTLNYVTREPFVHYKPPYIPPEPVETGHPVSPSTYSLTWLYHIIIRAVPGCPVTLSSVQTRSPP